jgi:hypothetical protein
MCAYYGTRHAPDDRDVLALRIDETTIAVARTKALRSCNDPLTEFVHRPPPPQKIPSVYRPVRQKQREEQCSVAVALSALPKLAFRLELTR